MIVVGPVLHGVVSLSHQAEDAIMRLTGGSSDPSAIAAAIEAAAIALEGTNLDTGQQQLPLAIPDPPPNPTGVLQLGNAD